MRFTVIDVPGSVKVPARSLGWNMSFLLRIASLSCARALPSVYERLFSFGIRIMPAHALSGFEPRKTPIQTRAAVTVDAISEATIQVLLKQGLTRLTTTRVAERAGVSVGTLYQYYPNKQALLFAVLADHFDKVASAVDAACTEARHTPLSDMIRTVVEAFVDAKMARIDVSLALYQFAADVGGPALVKRVGQRSRKALDAMLQTAPDLASPPDKFAVEMMFAAMAGTTRYVLEAGAAPAMIRSLRQRIELVQQTWRDRAS
jgi:AcrR family transcriptional regulator